MHDVWPQELNTYVVVTKISLYGSWQCKVAKDAWLDKEREMTLLIFDEVNRSLGFRLTSLSFSLSLSSQPTKVGLPREGERERK